MRRKGPKAKDVIEPPEELIIMPLYSITEAFFYFIARNNLAPFTAINETTKKFRVVTIKKLNNLKVKFIAFRAIFV